MALATYRLLALKWQPSQKEDGVFLVVALLTMALMLTFGVIVSNIDVPEKSRQIRAEVPERVAKFINKKPKPPKPPKPAKPKPKPKPKPPEPEVKQEKPKVERIKPKVKKEPLSKKQKDARDKVKDMGMLKHLSELSDLVETPVSSQLKTKIKKSDDAKVAAGHDVKVLTAGASDGSGGVNSAKYATTAGSSTLSAAELATANALLEESNSVFSEEPSDGGSRGRIRSEEEIILVIDRHKSKLQKIYNRARRKNPSLKGMLVLEITILPNGVVSSVKIVSSELNDPKLERSMMARIKKLDFGAKDVDSATVRYPIEFLPY